MKDLPELNLKIKLDIAKKIIQEKEEEIKKLKSQIPCPLCRSRGSKRYCPACQVICAHYEINLDETCIYCKTKVINCPECKGTGRKYYDVV